MKARDIGPRAWTVPYLSYSTLVHSVLTANLAFSGAANLLLHALIYTRRGNNDDLGRQRGEEELEKYAGISHT